MDPSDDAFAFAEQDQDADGAEHNSGQRLAVHDLDGIPDNDDIPDPYRIPDDNGQIDEDHDMHATEATGGMAVDDPVETIQDTESGWSWSEDTSPPGDDSWRRHNVETSPEGDDSWHHSDTEASPPGDDSPYYSGEETSPRGDDSPDHEDDEKRRADTHDEFEEEQIESVETRIAVFRNQLRLRLEKSNYSDGPWSPEKKKCNQRFFDEACKLLLEYEHKHIARDSLAFLLLDGRRLRSSRFAVCS